MRTLFFSPVGRSAEPLLAQTIECFGAAGAELLLVQYDEGALALPAGVPLLQDSGTKWQLARKHLHPDTCAAYDYIFVWDDDIDVADFDPVVFTAIMAGNRLDMAQPSMRSNYGLSHGITRQRDLAEEMRTAGIVGRLTNFVEVMVPVFSREGWRLLHEVLDDSNLSGWGYDYLPIAPRGIVDCMHVVHTRPVRSRSERAETEMNRTLGSYGLFAYPHIEMGWLFAETNTRSR